MSDPCQDAKDLLTSACDTLDDAKDIVVAAAKTVGELCSSQAPALSAATNQPSEVCKAMGTLMLKQHLRLNRLDPEMAAATLKRLVELQASEPDGTTPTPEPEPTGSKPAPSPKLDASGDFLSGLPGSVAAADGVPMLSAYNFGPAIGPTPGIRTRVLPQGLTPVTPSTIGSHLKADARLVLEPGVYGQLSLAKPNIHLYGLEEAFIRGPKMASGDKGTTVRITADGCELHHLEMLGGWYVVHIDGASHTLIQDCRIVGDGPLLTKEGVQVGPDRRGVGNEIRFCEISDTHDGVSLEGDVDNRVAYCLLHHLYDDAIEFDASNAGSAIGNRIWQVQQSAFSLQGSGAGPYVIEDNEAVCAQPFKVREKSQVVCRRNIIVGERAGQSYAEVFFAEGGEFTHNVIVMRGGSLFDHRGGKERLPGLIDHNAWACDSGVLINYHGMTTLEQMQANGHELNGVDLLKD